MTESFMFDVADLGRTTAFVYRAPEPANAVLLLAHGAGAPQTHPFMVTMAKAVASRGTDVVTFNFLYSERGRKLPDRSAALEACFLAAIASVRARSGLSQSALFCGGKSMGGRIASNLAASASWESSSASVRVRGLVFLGYPLHPASKPKVRRDEHLPRVRVPMLFVQGTRDSFGSAAELQALATRLPNASVHVVNGGDHSFAFLARDGGAPAAELAGAQAADAIVAFVRRHT